MRKLLIAYNTANFLNVHREQRYFLPSEKPDHLFFILDGEVKVFGTRQKAALGNGVFGEGDHFGEEALGDGNVHKTRAESVSQTSLLSINRKNLSHLMKIYPKLHDAFVLMYQSWKVANELVLHMARTG